MREPTGLGITNLTEQLGDLQRLATASRLRTLAPRRGLDFSSNDYLGLATSGVLADAARHALDRGVALGSGGSRLLRGNDPEHEALEARAALFFQSEAALFFSTGFAANSALLATLPQRDDIILYDELIHASSHEGMRLSRATNQRVGHNDLNQFADALAGWRGEGNTGTPWLLVESLYSMDGDIAPLRELHELADAYGAILVIDEAHATGVLGPAGRGLSAKLPHRDKVIALHTLGKALGCEGALLCGPAVMRDFLVNRGRGFIFSTAPSPLMAAVAGAALNYCATADNRRTELAQRIDHAGRAFAALGVTPSGSQIMPLIIGEDQEAMAAAAHVQAAGFDVRGIRPPTVPEGTARLRVTITLNISDDDVTALTACLQAIWTR